MATATNWPVRGLDVAVRQQLADARVLGPDTDRPTRPQIDRIVEPFRRIAGSDAVRGGVVGVDHQSPAGYWPHPGTPTVPYPDAHRTAPRLRPAMTHSRSAPGFAGARGPNRTLTRDGTWPVARWFELIEELVAGARNQLSLLFQAVGIEPSQMPTPSL